MFLSISQKRINTFETIVTLEFREKSTDANGEVHSFLMQTEVARLFIPTLRSGLSMWNDRELVEIEASITDGQHAYLKGE